MAAPRLPEVLGPWPSYHPLLTCGAEACAAVPAPHCHNEQSV